ncbi:MAG: HlyC/CorC family transporter [Deltaproteobacteria bacterium]|nr:HlyC/CorC family transporter [Deltaproteobacteria bacterium]
MSAVFEASGYWLWDVGALVLTLFGVALLASVETALGGVPEARVRLARTRKMENAHHLTFWLDHPGRVLTTIHFLRLCMVVAMGVTAVGASAAVGLDWPWIASVAVVGAVTMLFGHLVPRLVAKKFALEWALSTIRIVRVIVALLRPVVWPLMFITRLVSRLMGIEPPERGSVSFWTPDEVGQLAEESRADALGRSGEDIYRSIIEFSDTVIREIMVPRTEMMALAADSTAEEVRARVVEGGHSRIPVYEDTIDNVLGLLYVKDLSAAILRSQESAPVPRPNLRAMVRPTFYVPEVMKISELLREFQKRKTHMAIVVDEYGGTAGVVTLEDIIEEIVGEIQDEYDVDEKQFRVISENKILADGRVSVWAIEEALDVEFPDDLPYETLAGFLTARAGYLPEAGTVITWNNLRFTVKEANERRIGTVEIERRRDLAGG